MTSVISLDKIQILNLIKKNINNSNIPINSHKEIIPIDKEWINDNHENSNTQKRNQKSTKNEFTSDVINKISSSSNQNSSASSEQNITESGHNNKSTTKKKDTKDREIADKTVSNNISSGSKSAKKKMFVLGDSIIKHVKSYSLSKSLDNCKVYVKDFPGARVRCMQDYVRPTIRENPNHIILHVGTNDLTTNIPPEKVVESIIDLASSLKSNSCSVAISNITVRNDRYRKKVVQVNRHLKTLCIERNFELITQNIITEKHLNGSKLHLNKRGTVILSNTFTEAISNSIYWHCFMHSLENSKVSNTITCDEFNAKKPKENTYLNFNRKGNLNRLVLAHININSIRNKFDTLVQQITNNIDILMISETKLDNSFPEGQFLIPGYGSPYRFDRNCRGMGGAGVVLCCT